MRRLEAEGSALEARVARQASLRRAPGEQSLLPIYTEHAEPTPLEGLSPQVRVRVRVRDLHGTCRADAARGAQPAGAV